MTFYEELRDYLLKALDCVSGERGRGQCWVMNPEWLNEVRRVSDSGGRPLWQPSIPLGSLDALFGMPVVVKDDGGAPHLEDIPAP